MELRLQELEHGAETARVRTWSLDCKSYNMELRLQELEHGAETARVRTWS